MPVTEVLIQRISPSRAVAFEVLELVGQGGYASDCLLAAGRQLSARDAALASQIVFGCLRFQGQLDYLIRRYSGKEADGLDPPVRIALRAGIFQLRYLERVPHHAAVHEAVEYMKLRKRAASGLVNAVLRKVNREPVQWPDAATELSCPGWMLDRWAEHFGGDAARRIGQAALEVPRSYIRVSPGKTAPEGVVTEPTAIAGCFRIAPDGTGSGLKLRLQDIGSQAILPLLDLQPDQSYLDLCAAPGNKTAQALETPLRVAVACDVSFSRIAQMPPDCDRVVLDATRPLPFGKRFDRIFVDAPCSGTGTMARNPEIKWRVQRQDFERFRHKQVRIVQAAAKLLSPRGKLLYATCSLEREENEAVIAEVLAAVPELACVREMWRLPGTDEGDGFYAALLQ